MPKRVAEAGGASGYRIYEFIRDLIMEAGNDAELVGKTGRYRLNWPRALDRYADYKAKKNPHFKRTNQTRRKASNSLRSALLNFYKKEGAREYKESKKVNAKDEVVERQFQMPPRVFEALFSDAKLSDSNEEQDEKERKRHLSEGGVGAQASPESSSDAGFDELSMDESMDLCCDFSGSPEPLDLTSFDNLLTNPSLDDSADVNTECSGTHFSDCAFQPQIFDEDSVESALEEILLSDETSGLMEVVTEIFPESGLVEGGYPFNISLSEPLPNNVSSGTAEFQGVGTVALTKKNSVTLSGFVPASDQAREVGVKVLSQYGEHLGWTRFCYVDEMRGMIRRLLRNKEMLSSFVAMWLQEYHLLGLDQDATTQAKQKQWVKILELLVYTAAQTGAKQFIEMIFSTSAQQIVFNSYKERATLPEDVARANGHFNLAQYLQDINTRLTKEVNDEPKSIDWLELLKAVQNQVSASHDKESKEETTPAESDDNSSDYFADDETSSCGSFEHDDEFTSNPEGKDAAEKDSPTGESKERLLKDPPYSSIPDVNHLEDSKPPDEKQSDSSFLESFSRRASNELSDMAEEISVLRFFEALDYLETLDLEGFDLDCLTGGKERLLKDPPYSSIPDFNHLEDSKPPEKKQRDSLLRRDCPTGESKERLLKDPPYSSIPDVNHLKDSKPPDKKQRDSSVMKSLLRRVSNELADIAEEMSILVRRLETLDLVDFNLVSNELADIAEEISILVRRLETLDLVDFNLGGVSRYERKEEKRVLMTENVVVSASTCRLKRPGCLVLSPLNADERQLNQEQVIFEKSIGDESVHSASTLLPSCPVLNKSRPQPDNSASLHGLFSGNVSWKNESNMKELKMERVRSWLSCNPNSEEFPSAEDEDCVVSFVAASQDKESKEKATPAESDDNSSYYFANAERNTHVSLQHDYFANAETSSRASFEHDEEFTSNPEGKDAAEKGF